jgi:hypothetical protein
MSILLHLTSFTIFSLLVSFEQMAAAEAKLMNSLDWQGDGLIAAVAADDAYVHRNP